MLGDLGANAAPYMHVVKPVQSKPSYKEILESKYLQLLYTINSLTVSLYSCVAR